MATGWFAGAVGRVTAERESALEGEREQRDSHFRYRSYGSGDRCFGFVTESASSSERRIRGVMKMNSSDWAGSPSDCRE